MPIDLYREFEHYGLDTRSSVSKRKPGYFEDCLNVMNTLSGSVIKRPGYKIAANSIGGEGLFAYARPDNNVVEALTLYQGSLYRNATTTFTITYAGSGEATCSFFYDDDQAEYAFFLYVDGEEVLNSDLALGFEGEFATTLADLETDIEEVTDFSVTIAGTSTIPAAHLVPLLLNEPIDTTLSLTAWQWEQVNCPLASPLLDHWETRNDSDFQRATCVDVIGNKYIGSREVELMKYDGQTFYRAGMPQPSAPILSATTGSGVAEVTVITCVADTAATEITQVTFGTNNVWNQSNNGSAIKFCSASTTYGLYLKWGGAPDLPPAGVDVTMQIFVGAFNSTKTNDEIAELFRLKIQAQTATLGMTATRSGAVLTVTNAATGERDDAEVLDLNGIGETIDIVITSQGSTGLDGKYFILGGPDETIAFWYDVGNNGTTVPAHGATRAVKITGVVASDTADTVATVTEAAIEADAFNSTVSTNTITATSSTAGARIDGDPGTSGFGMSVTTQGVEGGIGEGSHIYHLTYQQTDHNGIVTEGMFSDDADITLAAGEYATVVIEQIQPDTGFNTGCALVNGNQANVNTITVTANHTLEIGDIAYFKGQTQAAVKEITRIDTTGLTAASLDGTFFYLFGLVGDSPQAWAFWFDIDNNGTTMPSHSAPNSVEITAINTGDSAGTIATAIGNAINGVGKWTRSVTTNVITVTDSAFGPRTDAYDGESASNLAISTTTQGSDFRSGENLYRTVTATAATTITIDGDPVTLLSTQPISNGLAINLWRTENNGVAISKFLVDTFPNNSFTETASYIDQIGDSALGRVWEEPKLDHGLPPKGAYVSAWNNIIVMGGTPDNKSTLYYSIPGESSPEYFPPEGNQILLNSIYGDCIKGLYPFTESFPVFKDNSYFMFSGDIYQDNVRVDQMMKTDLQFTSQHSFVDQMENVMFLDKEGVFSLSPGAALMEVSALINPSFDLGDSAMPLRAQGAIRRDLNHIYFYVPIESESDAGDRYALPTSPTFVLYTSDKTWHIWDQFNMAGGMIRIGNDYFFQEECFDEDTQAMRYHLYRVHREGLPSDYADVGEPISASFRVRYGADTPEIYKKVVRVRVQHDPALIGDDETVDVVTHLGLTSTAPHSSFSLLPDTVGRSKQRLLPTKSTAIGFTFSNDRVNESMALIGWTIEGGQLGNTTSMKE